MANNCLITKLKGVVDNNNLPKFGEIIFEIDYDGTNDAQFSLNCLDACIVKTIEGTFKDGTTEYSLSANTQKVFYFNAYAKVSIAPIYGMRVFNSSRLSDLTIDTSLFKFCNNLYIFSANSINGKVSGKISDFALSANTLTTLLINQNNNDRNIIVDDIPYFPNVTEFAITNKSDNQISTSIIAQKFPKIYQLSYTIMSGDVSNLGFMRNNINSSHKGDINCASGLNNVSGTVESIIGNDTTTYGNWYRINLPSTVTVTRSTYTALKSAGCRIQGATVIDD